MGCGLITPDLNGVGGEISEQENVLSAWSGVEGDIFSEWEKNNERGSLQSLVERVAMSI